LARLRALRSDLIDPTVAVHHGRVVKRTGDGSLIEFRSVVDAVRCAIEVQNGMVERNAGLPPERRIGEGFGATAELLPATTIVVAAMPSVFTNAKRVAAFAGCRRMQPCEAGPPSRLIS